MDRRIILLLPLVLIVSLFPSQIIPNGHAGGYTGTGLVCINYPATANNCSSSAASIGPVTVGSSFTVGVLLNNSAPMAGFDIYVAVNASYLNPTNAVLGPLIASPTLTTICIDGSSVTGSCTGQTANGPGVVEVSTLESSGANECGNSPPCSGLAFNITYNVIGTTASTPIFYPVDGAGCSPNSVASPTNVCVFVGDSGGNALPENIQGARVTQSVTVNPTSTAVSCTSPITVGMSTSCTATVTDTGATGATNPTGQVAFSTGGPGGFNPTKCTLSSVGTRQASCSANYTPTGNGTHNIGAGYSGDTIHTGSTATVFPLAVSPAGLTLSTTIMLDSTGQPVNASRGVSTSTSVHDTALLLGGYPITGVTGTVTYTEYSDNNCAGVGTFISRVNLGAENNVPRSGSVSISSPGNYSFQAVYSGDASNLPATNCVSLTAGTTSTAITCSPTPLDVKAQTTCVATVTDITPTPTSPSGTVSFTTNSTGTLTPPNSCTLAASSTTGISSCSITYVPTGIGHHLITGIYGGDSTHSKSTSTANMAVTIRDITTSLSCSPKSEAVGTPTKCTITVTDTSSIPISPTGTVNFATNSSGAFSSTSCTLAPGTSGISFCSVSYTPTAVGSGAHLITVSYMGDSAHSSNNANSSLSVNSPAASPNIQLYPPIFYSMIGAIVALVALLVYLALGRRQGASAKALAPFPSPPPVTASQA